MQRYSVLIVEDSAFMRRAISLILESDPEFFIAGIARNGQEALEKISRFKPDVVTMDVEMPEMDGITALSFIMKEQPLPVVMLSVQTGNGTDATLQALELGAVDFFLKSDLIKDTGNERAVRDFLARMKIAAKANVGRVKQELTAPPVRSVKASGRGADFAADMLVIGCSTGGPSALQTILPRFPADMPSSIFVVQHMPEGFTGPLAERFNTICDLRVKEAQDGDLITPGTIFIAPAGYQSTFIRGTDGSVSISVQTNEVEQALYKPSVDVTLRSAAAVYGSRLVSVILTGMGVDGLQGCEKVKQHGGRVITETEESCVVYGMPKAVFEAGLADKQASLSSMYYRIMSFIYG
ncbi:chemotaxis response regulator protein-glutamate methylesterase [Paenibacillus sambharensis]|uniref:Protein-glutamate methylesterase/protein-glutamine glutaminase n=1 Tax=Paenibacillus sambharensis TaxID=1803190 RepID=A0A2W1L9B2_9BACL|nr:chemotaxis response regulator protein-glutamate methylesterase [Paenibacillus sambharensis]PZD95349.1 chemotaxis response regulator protein-glutamate methylesterase [Paenibacillus sambharensis]